MSSGGLLFALVVGFGATSLVASLVVLFSPRSRESFMGPVYTPASVIGLTLGPTILIMIGLTLLASGLRLPWAVSLLPIVDPIAFWTGAGVIGASIAWLLGQLRKLRADVRARGILECRLWLLELLDSRERTRAEIEKDWWIRGGVDEVLPQALVDLLTVNRISFCAGKYWISGREHQAQLTNGAQLTNDDDASTEHEDVGRPLGLLAYRPSKPTK